MWLEDEDGNFLAEPDADDNGDPFGGEWGKAIKSGKGKYYNVRFPFELRTFIHRLTEDGSEEVGSSGGTFDGNLVVAIVNSGDYDYNQSVILAADSCERCLNVLLNRYIGDRDHGYEEFSEGWKKSGTQCRHCEHLPWKRPYSLGRPYILCVGTMVGYRIFLQDMDVHTKLGRESFKLITNPDRARGIRDSDIEDIWWIHGANQSEIGRNPGCLDWLQQRIDQARKDRGATNLTRVEPPIQGTT